MPSRPVAAGAGVVAALVLAAGATTLLPGAAPEASAEALVPYDSCGALLEQYRAELEKTATPWGFGAGFGLHGGGFASAESRSAATLTAAAPQPAGASLDQSAGAGVTGTNLQERGVDEPDLAKTSGDLLLAVGQNRLQVLRRGPVPELLGSAPLGRESWNAELLVDGDRVLVIVGSYVPDGAEVGEWVQSVAQGVVAFYDIDTPVTLAQLARAECPYLHPRLIPHYDLYLSFSGGPALRTLEQRYGSPLALPLYCSVDPQRYRPESLEPRYDLGYMGTYSDDRQPVLERLLLEPAAAWAQGRFAVAGPQYPEEIAWPENVERIEHLGPALHGRFYNEQRFTLNVTRADMVAAGWSPSVRLFEAAACATPIVSDPWDGLETLFEPGEEILITQSGADVLQWIRDMPEERRRRIGEGGRRRILAEHTAGHRAETLERYFERAARRRPAHRPLPRPAAVSIHP
ncbi:MAG: glycosyltransferase [Proteobacteria bacterium]|nr:glycosyltransferase [Pseudomonadota bacterium]